MDMYLDEVIPFRYNHGFAPGHELLTHFSCANLAWADDKFCTVWIINREIFSLGFQSLDNRLHRFHIHICHLAGKTIETANQEEYQPLTACVDNVCVSQNLKLLWCSSQCFFSGYNSGFQYLAKVWFYANDFTCTLGNASGYRKDGPFHRCGNSTVSIEDTILECLTHLTTGGCLLAMQAFCQTMNNLGKDNTGVASGPHDGTGSGFFSNNANWFIFIHGSNHAVHGTKSVQHVVSGITVRNREYVQLVDNVIFLTHQLICAN